MINKIVMADDEVDIVQILQKRMTQGGFQVYSAHDGQSALDLTVKHVPDLIITDVMMPIMNGFEFCKAVKQNIQTKDIPIIVVSAKGSIQDSFMFLGVNDFLHKPFKLEQLESKIHDKLNMAKMMHTQKTKIIFHSFKGSVISNVRTMMEEVPQWTALFTNSAAELLVMAKDHVPDLVVIDLLMTGASVPEVIAEIKQNPLLVNTDILIYYSPLNINEDNFTQQAKMIEIQYLKNAALNIGAKEYLGPFNPERIMEFFNSYRKDVAV